MALIVHDPMKNLIRKFISTTNLTEIVICLGLIALSLGHLAKNQADYDLWGYLAFGRLYWNSGSFPYHDIFSYLPTKDLWVYHEWLTGVLFFPIYKALGAFGLQLLKFLLGIVSLGSIYSAAKKQGAKPIAIGLALYLALYIIPFGYSPVRAQLFTYFFFALNLYILENYRITKRWRSLWWLVLIQLLWCNLHGGFVAGIGLLFLYMVGEAASGREYKPYCKVLPFAILVTLINPYGIKYWTYLVKAITMPRPEIVEWQSVFSCIKGDRYFWDSIFFISLVCLSLTFTVCYRRRRHLTSIFLLLGTAYMGFKSIRHIVFFGLVFVTYMPLYFNICWDKFSYRIKNLRKLIVVILISLFLIDSLAFFSSKFIMGSPFDLKTRSKDQTDGKISASYYPIGAINYMRKHNLKGNILAAFDWGEFIICHFFPDCLVALDGRYETVYPHEISEEYFDFLYGRDGWLKFLNDYPHDIILLKSNSGIAQLLRIHPSWIERYRDSGSVIFISDSMLSDIKFSQAGE